MKKFVYSIQEVYSHDVEIQAETAEEAVSKVEEFLESGGHPDVKEISGLDYSHTLDIDADKMTLV